MDALPIRFVKGLRLPVLIVLALVASSMSLPSVHAIELSIFNQPASGSGLQSIKFSPRSQDKIAPRHPRFSTRPRITQAFGQVCRINPQLACYLQFPLPINSGCQCYFPQFPANPIWYGIVTFN